MARVTHFEIAVDAPQTSIDFYMNVFAWKVDKWAGPMDYWLITTGEDGALGIDGAFSDRESLQQPITLVIEVDDAAGYMDKIIAHGGEMIGELQEIPGVGISGYFKDPAGNLLGVMQPAGQPE